MGREVRRVPKDWEHPKNRHGNYQPMYDRDFETAAEEWMKNCLLWAEGKHPDQAENKDRPKYFWQWSGDPPDEKYYRPKWTDEERTHLQMYEDCSEGTPISPVMETPEELARWLADNNASACGDMTATYKQWFVTIKRGWAITMIMDKKGLRPGVCL